MNTVRSVSQYSYNRFFFRGFHNLNHFNLSESEFISSNLKVKWQQSIDNFASHVIDDDIDLSGVAG